jgi:hypothetical protein
VYEQDGVWKEKNNFGKKYWGVEREGAGSEEGAHAKGPV